MTQQPDMFTDVGGTLVPAIQSRDKGIAIVLEHNSDWLDKAFELFPQMANHFRGLLVTGEDMRIYLSDRGVIPNHPNAWGAFTNMAAKRGLIVRSGAYQKMKEKQSHARETPLWIIK